MRPGSTLTTIVAATAALLTAAGCPGTLEDKERFEQGAAPSSSMSTAEVTVTSGGGGNGGIGGAGATASGNGGTGG